MKMIEAVIRRSKYNAVKKALHATEINFFSYWDVTGLGNQTKGKVYRGINYNTSDLQRRVLCLVVNDDFEEIVVETIIENAKTDDVGDGKIFVSDINEAYRIRTGEKGYKTIR